MLREPLHQDPGPGRAGSWAVRARELYARGQVSDEGHGSLVGCEDPAELGPDLWGPAVCLQDGTAVDGGRRGLEHPLCRETLRGRGARAAPWNSRRVGLNARAEGISPLP